MLKMTLKTLLCCGLITFAFGCGFSAELDGKDEDGEFTKDDARRQSGGDVDYCDLYNWYGDGECDEFCDSPDPDCSTVSCNAYPSCGPDRSEVEACPPDARCEVVEICGSSIICMDERVMCVAEAPDCGPDHRIVDYCDPDTDQCFTLENPCGGEPTYCEVALDNCLAYPVCPAGYVETDVCPFDDECLRTEMCGTTILCAPEEIFCDAIPVCPMGTEQVDTCPSDASCFEQRMCGTSILCAERMVNCDAIPVCPQGSTEVMACPPDASCFDQTVCGATITCMREYYQCEAYPVCPDGTTQVRQCSDADPNCVQISICGNSVSCRLDP